MKFFARKKNRRTLDQVEFATMIGEHAVYRGDLSGSDNYLVKGHGRGKCDIEGHLVLWPTAVWTGDIAASHVVIAGEVVGDVYAGVKLELKSTARIRGNITSPVIAMAQGALYDGEIRMRPRPQLVRFNEKRSS
jgi:cytoskeletal protein CcmA (bactofilin family)